jgi:2-keto-4-pentenoate hydratase/2-oxohepta-3-ene-1,7-dioic acid hydratase in catechol pathway
MRIGRAARHGLDGPEPRVVAVDLERDVAIDVQRAEQVRLQRSGSTARAARRLAAARIPASLAEGLGYAGYADVVREAAAADPPDDAVIALADVHWLAAIDPPRYRDFMSFEQHHLSVRHVLGRDVPAVTYELPTYYKGGHFGLIGHGEPMPWPGYSDWMDYELELGLVVGRGGADLAPGDAERCLFGVTLLNDFSARDRQFHENRGNLGPAKGKDFATAVGPWITTADEVDLLRVELTARVNGEEWARGVSGSAMWSAGELLAYLSTAEPLVPGELVGTGTLGGGCGLEVGRRLVPGDVVELEGAGLGVLRTPLGRPGTLRWEPPPRTPGVPIDGVSPVRISAPLPPRAGVDDRDALQLTAERR